MSLAPALAWNLPSGSHPLSVVHTYRGLLGSSLQGLCSSLLLPGWAIPVLSLHTHLFWGVSFLLAGPMCLCLQTEWEFLIVTCVILMLWVSRICSWASPTLTLGRPIRPCACFMGTGHTILPAFICAVHTRCGSWQAAWYVVPPSMPCSSCVPSLCAGGAGISCVYLCPAQSVWVGPEGL